MNLVGKFNTSPGRLLPRRSKPRAYGRALAETPRLGGAFPGR